MLIHSSTDILTVTLKLKHTVAFVPSFSDLSFIYVSPYCLRLSRSFLASTEFQFQSAALCARILIDFNYFSVTVGWICAIVDVDFYLLVHFIRFDCFQNFSLRISAPQNSYDIVFVSS